VLTKAEGWIAAALDDPSPELRHAALRVIWLILPLVADGELRHHVREIAESGEAEDSRLATTAFEQAANFTQPIPEPRTDQDGYASQQDEGMPWEQPHVWRESFERAADVGERIYPAVSLATVGEIRWIESVLGEIEAGPPDPDAIERVKWHDGGRRGIPPEVAKRLLETASDRTRRGDVRQIAWLLGRRSSLHAGEPPYTPDVTKPWAQKAANAFEEYLQTGGPRELYHYLEYLDARLATLLITEMFKRALQEGMEDRDTGYMAGNDVVTTVMRLGSRFVPDLPGLFKIYTETFRHASAARAEWYRTGDDDIVYLDGSPYLALGWQISWTMVRCGPQELIAGLASLLDSRNKKELLAGLALAEDGIRYLAIRYPPPLFGGATTPVTDAAAVAQGIRRALPSEYVSLAIFDAAESVERLLDVHEGLCTGVKYRLVVGMGMTPDERFAGGQQEKLQRPAGETVVLDVVVWDLARNLEIVNSWAMLEWPKFGPSLKNAEFVFQPRVPGRGRVRVLMYFEHDLLFCGDLDFEVGLEGDEWPQEGRPIHWETVAPLKSGQLALFRKFRDLDREARRRVNISVHRRTAERYDLLFFLRSGQPISPIYPLEVAISDREISDFAARARSALRDFTDSYQAGDSSGDAVGRFLDDMSLVGSKLWNKLFGSEAGQRLARTLKQELAEEGAIIQVWIEKAASDFILPWVWLYPLPVAAGRRQQPAPKQFWGYRYVIEQLREQPDEKRPSSTLPAEPLRIAAALHNFTAAAAERDFFTGCSNQSSGRLVWAEVKPTDWRRFLHSCDAHLVYFYCHGHTEQPLSTGETMMLRILQRVAVATKIARLTDFFTAELRKRVRDQSGITIEKEILNMSDLGEFKPAAATLRPIVFLNMCESAEFYPGATDNLIDVFLKGGARGVIGTEGPILAAFGDAFARQFFKSFFAPGKRGDGQEIGTVLWQLRRGLLDKGNPLGFAYTYFGDATTRLRPAIMDSISQIAEQE